MTEKVVLGILISLCFGQCLACKRGPAAGVIYYLCVAPLEYFVVWAFASWQPSTLCGLVLVAWPWLMGRRPVCPMRFHQHPLALFVGYVVVATLIGSCVWPYHTITGRSPIYSVLRAPVQILNFLLSMGIAWRIAEVIWLPGVFQRARSVLLTVAVPLCVYSVYQWQAVSLSLPVTGIRRPAHEITAETVGEQLAAYTLNSEIIYRPGSLMNEPKCLGTACILWSYLIIGELLTKGYRGIVRYALPLVLLALWLSASTSAWVGAVVAVCVGGFVVVRALAYRPGVVLLVFSLAALPVVMLPLLRSEQRNLLEDVYEERFSQRIAGPTSDRPEVIAQEILYREPTILLTGAGLGGISFYIAEAIGGSDMVLFPNGGYISFFCEYGAVGIVLLGIALRLGLRAFWRTDVRKDFELQLLAMAGVGVLLQNVIFPRFWLVPMAIGFLLGAEFRLRYGSASAESSAFACRRRVA